MLVNDFLFRALAHMKAALARFSIHVRHSALSPEAIGEFLNLLRPMRAGHELVRVGGHGDGGYLLPNDIQGITAVFSPGVGKLSRFEEHFANQGIPCFMVDGSVERPQGAHELFYFSQLWLRAVDTEGAISLETWVSTSGMEGDLLLQMDIEGGEYQVLLSCDSDILRRFRIIAIELHFLDALSSPPGRAAILAVLEKLALNHTLVHTHVNNHGIPLEISGHKFPQVVELTYLRTDRITPAGEQLAFAKIPNPLDEPNDSSRRDWHLSW